MHAQISKHSKPRPRTLPFLVAGFVLLAGVAGSGSPTQANEKSATDLIFSEPYLKKLEHPSTISYSYTHGTKTPSEYGAGFKEAVTVHVRQPTLEGGFNSVSIALRSDQRDYDLGPFENTSGNPVIMMFLERDLNQMRSRVGGAPVYFRNTIRRAFREGAEIADTTVEINGEQVAAKRITIRPFKGDRQAMRFGKFQGKVFETTVTDAVPGGIFTMKSFIPDTENEGEALVTNSLQYEPEQKQ